MNYHQFMCRRNASGLESPADLPIRLGVDRHFHGVA
jgi:hypothetical protein